MKKWMYVTAALVGLALTGCNTMYGEQEPNPERGLPWESVPPESRGIRSEDLARMVEHVHRNNLAIDSIVIYKDGTVPFEMYFNQYDSATSHNLKSTSKGVISALVGIAIHEGFIESVETPVRSYFPELDSDDPRMDELTIRDLLTMSAGLRWNENDLNSMYTFFVSKRIAERVLGQPFDEEPGSSFTYNTGLTHLLSVIISRASGMSTIDFARRFLFEPLEIQNVQWSVDRDGVQIGGSELFLTPRAMTKFGVLYLQNGVYDEQQVIPAEWVRESTTTQIEGSFHGSRIEYGYLWWLDVGNGLFTYLDGEDVFLAMGVHGQRILVHRDLNAVVVITADQGDESQVDILIRDFILPAL